MAFYRVLNGGTSEIVDSSHALILATNNASKLASFTSGTPVSVATTRGGVMIINTKNISLISSIKGTLTHATMNTSLIGITSTGIVSASLGFADDVGTNNINVSSYDYLAIVFGNATTGTNAVSFTVTI